jgi:hypothetical protein
MQAVQLDLASPAAPAPTRGPRLGNSSSSSSQHLALALQHGSSNQSTR